MAERPAVFDGRTVESALQHAWLTRNPTSIALWPLSLLYIAATAIQRGLVGLGLRPAVRLPVPVVVVGNLIVGGAGKTPTVLAVVKLLRQHGYSPGIVSRGYGRRHHGVVEVDAASGADDVGDEPMLLQRRSGAPVVVGADRVAAVRELLQRHPDVDVVVSDDGLQHHRLHRDAQVLVFDERGIGNGWRLPAGPLRERFSLAPPARSIVLYNAERASTPWPGHRGTRRLLTPIALGVWASGGTGSDDEIWPTWQGRPALAAAGVARPERFFAMLRSKEIVVTPLCLPDHFDFRMLPWAGRDVDVIVTEKDAVKLDPRQAANARVWVAALDFTPDDAFASALLELIGPGHQPTHGNRHGTPPL